MLISKAEPSVIAASTTWPRAGLVGVQPRGQHAQPGALAPPPQSATRFSGGIGWSANRRRKARRRQRQIMMSAGGRGQRSVLTPAGHPPGTPAPAGAPGTPRAPGPGAPSRRGESPQSAHRRGAITASAASMSAGDFRSSARVWRERLRISRCGSNSSATGRRRRFCARCAPPRRPDQPAAWPPSAPGPARQISTTRTPCKGRRRPGVEADCGMMHLPKRE